MKAGARVALGMGMGYLLGRSKKMRLALMIAAAGATGRVGTSPGKLLQNGLKQLGSSAELGQLTDIARDELLRAAKAAAVTAASGPIESLTERLKEGGGKPGKEEEEGEEPGDGEEQEPETAELAEDEAADETEDEAADETEDEAADETEDEAADETEDEAADETEDEAEAEEPEPESAEEEEPEPPARRRTSSRSRKQPEKEEPERPARRRAAGRRATSPADDEAPPRRGRATTTGRAPVRRTRR